ncbi:MAG: hypothetical protein Q8P81_03205 [Nanoarchaeota archaeon]|nr:hypothetical protein [Nanoarchaeota archaeon]
MFCLYTGFPYYYPYSKDAIEGNEIEDDRVTEEIKMDIDFLDGWEDEIEVEPGGNYYCNCSVPESCKNWAGGKEFWLCKKCKKEIE